MPTMTNIVSSAGPGQPHALRPRSLRAKTAVSLFLITALGLAGTLAAHFAIRRLDAKIHIIESFHELNQKILETRRHEKNFLLYGTSRDLHSAREYLDEVRAAIAPVQKFLRDSGEPQARPQDAELNAYANLLQQLSLASLTYEEKDALKEELRHQGQRLTDKVLAMDAQARQRAENDVRRFRLFSFAVIAINVLASLIIAILLIRWIIAPIEAIRQAAARVVGGELSTIPLDRNIRQSVEGEELVNTLNTMLATLSAKQSQLLQSAKLAVIGRVTAGIAHEINNPLNNISLTAEVLLEDLPSMACADRLEMVKDILVQADRAREVVRHLLDFSRAKKPSGWEPVDLGKIAASALALLKNQLRMGQLTASSALPAQPVRVSGNANQLEQVLVNIILNAIQASPPGGQVAVRVGHDQQAKRAWIEVTDSGPGVPEHLLPQLFEPFFTTKSDGTGLGLSLSYAIVREHNGDIVVDNLAGGARFRIVLPLHEVQQEGYDD